MKNFSSELQEHHHILSKMSHGRCYGLRDRQHNDGPEVSGDGSHGHHDGMGPEAGAGGM